MALELKQIAPYLPYGLKWKFDGEDFIYDVVGLDITDKGIKLESPYYDYGSCPLNEGYPVLRPLSQLVDSRYLFKVVSMQYVNINHADKCFIKNDGVYYGTTRLTTFNYMHTEAIQALPYYVVQYLLGHYFDVFGLIDKGLAIDINKL